VPHQGGSADAELCRYVPKRHALDQDLVDGYAVRMVANGTFPRHGYPLISLAFMV